MVRESKGQYSGKKAKEGKAAAAGCWDFLASAFVMGRAMVTVAVMVTVTVTV